LQLRIILCSSWLLSIQPKARVFALIGSAAEEGRRPVICICTVMEAGKSGPYRLLWQVLLRQGQASHFQMLVCSVRILLKTLPPLLGRAVRIAALAGAAQAVAAQAGAAQAGTAQAGAPQAGNAQVGAVQLQASHFQMLVCSICILLKTLPPLNSQTQL
jgi:hypothetical protein